MFDVLFDEIVDALYDYVFQLLPSVRLTITL